MKEDVLYLEADEEITAAIDRMVSQKASLVKIVVPKRSTLLQSIVNLKLLKRAADDAGKDLVLVTGDRTATHLAARVGLAVAETLKSEAKVPDAPDTEEVGDTVEAEEDPVEDVPAEKAAAAVAEMSAIPKAAASKKPAFARPMMVKTAVSEDDEVAVAPAKEVKGFTAPKVPSFDTLQQKVFWAVGGLGVIILLFILNWWFKSATLHIYAKGTKISASFDMTGDPGVKSSDAKQSVLAATELKSAHDLTATATATGKEDVGTKAHGTITVTNYCYNPGTLPAGTVFTASGGQKFVSTSDVAVPAAVPFLGNCGSTTANVPVTASQNGDSYNLASGTIYTVGSAPSDKLKGTGGQMSGGTSKIQTVLTQGDIDKARDEALTKDKDTAQKDLENKAGNSNKVLSATFNQTAGTVTSNPKVGEQASSATVTISVSYSELAVDKEEFHNFVAAKEQEQIGEENQLYDDGIDNAKITADKKDSIGRWPMHFSADAYAGAKLDKAAIAKSVTGKKYGDAADLLSRQAGVDHVEISLFPFWSTKLPSITDHIKVDIKVASKE